MALLVSSHASLDTNHAQYTESSRALPNGTLLRCARVHAVATRAGRCCLQPVPAPVGKGIHCHDHTLQHAGALPLARALQVGPSHCSQVRVVEALVAREPYLLPADRAQARRLASDAIGDVFVDSRCALGQLPERLAPLTDWLAQWEQRHGTAVHHGSLRQLAPTTLQVGRMPWLSYACDSTARASPQRTTLRHAPHGRRSRSACRARCARGALAGPRARRTLTRPPLAGRSMVTRLDGGGTEMEQRLPLTGRAMMQLAHAWADGPGGAALRSVLQLGAAAGALHMPPLRVRPRLMTAHSLFACMPCRTPPYRACAPRPACLPGLPSCLAQGAVGRPHGRGALAWWLRQLKENVC